MTHKHSVLAFFMLAALVGSLMAAVPPGIPDGWTDGYVYANGIRIHYYRAVPAPGKPVLVMAHGATDYGLNWTTLTKDLQANFDIYMVDARGHGYSDPPQAAATGDTGVEDLMGFLRAMKIEKPILMGHSMGAGSVMRLAAAYPEIPRAVIMLDPGLGAPPATPATPPAAPRPGSLLMFGDPEKLVAQNNRPYEGLVAQCTQESPKWDLLDCQYWAVSKKLFHGNYASPSQTGFPRPNAAETLAKITAPALILKADAPPETRKANDEVAKALKNGKLVHIDGAAHNLHHDQRQRTVEEIMIFLKPL
jgi:pimeloyl-ACP methyl ester carboxylesterase